MQRQRAGSFSEADLQRLMETRDWSALERAGEQIAAEAPDRGAGWYFVGTAQLRSGRIDQGVASLRRAVELDPDEGEFHRVLGVGLVAGYRFAEAVPALLCAARIEPGPDADLPLAYAYCCLGRVTEAREVLGRVAPGDDPELTRKRAELMRMATSSHFAGNPGELVVAGSIALRALFGEGIEDGLRTLGLTYGAFALAYLFVARKPGPKVVRSGDGPLAWVRWLAEQAVVGIVGVTFLPLTVTWWAARRWLGWFGGLPAGPQAGLGSGGRDSWSDSIRRVVADEGAAASSARTPPAARRENASVVAGCAYAGRARVRAGRVVLSGRQFDEGDVLCTIDRGGRVRLGDATWGDPWGFVGGDGVVFEGWLPDGLDPTDTATALIYGRRSDLRAVGGMIRADSEGMIADLGV